MGSPLNSTTRAECGQAENAPKPSAQGDFHVGLLVIQATLEQDLEQRIVPPRPPMLPVSFGHLQGGPVPTNQGVRQVRRREDQTAVAS